MLRAAVAQRWSPGTVLGREGVDSAAVHLLVSGLVRRHQRNAAHQNFGRSESSSHDDAASPVSVVVAAKGAAKNLKSRRASICVTPSAAAAGGVEMPKAGGRYRRHSKVFRRASLMYQNASNIAKLLGQDNEVPVRRDTRRWLGLVANRTTGGIRGELPFRGARPYPSYTVVARLNIGLSLHVTSETCGRCPSSKGHSLSPRARLLIVQFALKLFHPPAAPSQGCIPLARDADSWPLTAPLFSSFRTRRRTRRRKVRVRVMVGRGGRQTTVKKATAATAAD